MNFLEDVNDIKNIADSNYNQALQIAVAMLNSTDDKTKRQLVKNQLKDINHLKIQSVKEQIKIESQMPEPSAPGESE